VPIYEYRCKKCGHRFETIQKVSDPPLNKCEKCKGKAERLVSSPAIQFKGSGWYVTDYARKSSGGDGAKAESSSEKTASSDSSDKPSAEKPAGKKTKEKAGASK
jgi:putative FmdB family regulatory protein